MFVQIIIDSNSYRVIWKITKYHMNENDMKQSVVVYRYSLKKLRRPTTQNSIKTKPLNFIESKQSRGHNKIKRYQEQQLKQTLMDENNESHYEFSHQNLNEQNALINIRNIEKQQHDKENYLEIYNSNSNNNNINYHHTKPYEIKHDDENNGSCDSTAKLGDNIEQERIQHVTVIDGELIGDKVDDSNCEQKLPGDDVNDVADILPNKYLITKCTINEDTADKQKCKKININLGVIQSLSPSSSYFFNASAVAPSRHQHLKQSYLNTKDLNEDVLHGHQINVHNILDVGGGDSLCVGPMGALCDMAALSKLDYCSPFAADVIKDCTQNNQDFLAKKYYHPLYANGVCRWPGCELPLDDMALFVKHLKTVHCLDDRSTAQARVQMQVVSQLEMHLQKERDRLQAMMHHLYLTKHFVMPVESQENMSHIRYKNSVRTDDTTPDLNKSNNENIDDSDGGAIDLQSLLINSGNITATRKRICDKSPLALAGGLPYMLERAGLDVQQEIQRNREFYKNADVRPPFTYASLIRQSIIESPDKQLTLNEIYNWFQNTFCYFRRNAATWKNAIRTNLSLHKCFVRYEDDFGSFWMVDDSEFVKRRHLSRGRPRKYEPSSSPNSNSQQFGSTVISGTSSDVADGDNIVSGDDTIVTNILDSSTAGLSSVARCASRGSVSNLYHRSGNKSNSSDNNGGNDDYDICEVSQRSPAAGYLTHHHTTTLHHSARKKYCNSKHNSHLQGSMALNISMKRNINSFIDHNYHHISNRITNVAGGGGGVLTTENNPGVGGIDCIGSVGSLDVDNHDNQMNINNMRGVETEDQSGYDFQTHNLTSDTIFNSPTGSKNNNGRYSPNLQNMWAFGSSLSDEVTSNEFACINTDRYRNFVAGLHLQSLTQRHHFHQHKPLSQQRINMKTQQQNSMRRTSLNQQHDVRSLHETQGFHIYHKKQDEQQQKLIHNQQNQQQQPLGQDIFGINAILSNTEEYYDSHNMESRNEDDAYKQETFNMGQQQQQQQQQQQLQQQQHLAIKHHLNNSPSEPLATDEIANHVYIHHQHNHTQEIDVKYTPPHQTQYNFGKQHRHHHHLNKSDIISNKKRSGGSNIYSIKNSSAAAAKEEAESTFVDHGHEGMQPKRKKISLTSINYGDLDIKPENETDLNNVNVNVPLRTKSY